ncbi:MAG: hypothetical protein D3910_21755 [Candidatus Electrothrix sp. ATG2]|nr:hypothetical protein [Candidatus Electrothrix sp. ATG2]
MNTDSLNEAQYGLRKILVLHGQDLTLLHTWVWEGDRWKELVFALGILQKIKYPSVLAPVLARLYTGRHKG